MGIGTCMKSYSISAKDARNWHDWLVCDTLLNLATLKCVDMDSQNSPGRMQAGVSLGVEVHTF